jgi:hypothetical protein
LKKYETLFYNIRHGIQMHFHMYRIKKYYRKTYGGLEKSSIIPNFGTCRREIKLKYFSIYVRLL